MPLQVFDKNGLARETSIIRAINFAIDHGANIINVSIGESEFRYSDRFDDVIKRAYNEGIIIVIAAGNGDTAINEGRGVDTTLHPISPVCNNDGQTKYTL